MLQGKPVYSMNSSSQGNEFSSFLKAITTLIPAERLFSGYFQKPGTYSSNACTCQF